MKNLFIIWAVTDTGRVYGVRPEKIRRNYLKDLIRGGFSGRVQAGFVPDRQTRFVKMQLYYGPHVLANDLVNGIAGYLVAKNGEFTVHYNFKIYPDAWKEWKSGDEV